MGFIKACRYVCDTRKQTPSYIVHTWQSMPQVQVRGLLPCIPLLTRTSFSRYPACIFPKHLDTMADFRPHHCMGGSY